ncbi:HAD-IA family hydrolase [Cupriavidus basilensis]|uniref:HAD-IA family hydrolase n=1 Tax=Cupriavidus basilensis TaxID=68895 RepID=A0ABT6AGA4_9BURK|nr:HAD-IA family hydrolase [Cupriavidus basilensis]MDF3831357.1 HAD-IA family hydrolase [Cupriavidus basilensis]
MTVNAVVFDFGGVLFDWSPEYLYRELIPDPLERARFLSEVCSPAWNIRQDAGRPLLEATELLVAEHPSQAELIRAFYGRWPQMLRGPLPGGVDLLRRLHAAEVPLFGLTNWSSETYPHAERSADFLHMFRDILVSGEVGIAKPDPAIYQLMHARIGARLPGIAPQELLFIDDNAANVAAATALGWQAVHHASAGATEAALRAAGLRF